MGRYSGRERQKPAYPLLSGSFRALLFLSLPLSLPLCPSTLHTLFNLFFYSYSYFQLPSWPMDSQPRFKAQQLHSFNTKFNIRHPSGEKPLTVRTSYWAISLVSDPTGRFPGPGAQNPQLPILWHQRNSLCEKCGKNRTNYTPSTVLHHSKGHSTEDIS